MCLAHVLWILDQEQESEKFLGCCLNTQPVMSPISETLAVREDNPFGHKSIQAGAVNRYTVKTN